MSDVDQLHNDLERARQEIAGPVPTIEVAPDCTVTLVRGLTYNGKAQKRVEVRELTGNDEEQLARYKKPEEFFDAVVALGTVRLGEMSFETMPFPERQGHMRQLLIGERDMIFLAIARATYGDERRVPYTCPLCKREQEIGYQISEDFKPRQVENIEERSFIYKTTKGQDVEVRLPTGVDQLEVLGKEGVSSPEMNTTLLASCILSVNAGLVVDPLNFARGLSMRDRQTLINQMIDRQPSVDLSLRFPCHGCQEEQQVNFGWLDFFRL
jgi:hypothetical protein